MQQPMRFDEIVFVDDFFRSSANLLQSHPANRRFLRGAFENSASRLGLRCREICAGTDGGELDVAAMMQALGLTASAAGWAQSCIADLAGLVEPGLLPQFRPNMLVVGWGLSPALLGLLDRAGASFLDVEIAPIRFASHLSFHMRTNDRQIEAVLRAHRIEDEDFWNQATAVRAFFARRGAGRIFDPGLRIGLFVGQCAIDLALVGNGRIMTPLDAVDAARTLAREVDLLVIKPHPYEPDLRHLREMAAGIPNAAWTDSNLYALFCADNLRFVCGLSSSAIREAGYFLKEGLQFLTPDRDNRKYLPAACSDWIPTSIDILSLHALRQICRPAVAGPAAPGPARLPEDLLDGAFGSRWGLDPASNGLPELPTLVSGTAFDLRQPGHAGHGWLSFGWSRPEPHGIWTEGRQACMVLPLPRHARPGSPALRIQIEGRVFAGRPDSRPQVQLRMNGAPALPLRSESTGTQTERSLFELQIPAAAAGQALVLLFDIEHPMRPCDCDSSKDSRQLGFLLEGLRMDLGEPQQIPPEDSQQVCETTPLFVPQPSHRLRSAVLGLTIAMAAVAILGRILPLDDGDTQPIAVAQLGYVTTSPWQAFKEKFGANVELVRTDLRAILKRHEI